MIREEECTICPKIQIIVQYTRQGRIDHPVYIRTKWQGAICPIVLYSYETPDYPSTDCMSLLGQSERISVLMSTSI